MLRMNCPGLLREEMFRQSRPPSLAYFRPLCGRQMPLHATLQIENMRLGALESMHVCLDGADDMPPTHE